MTKLKNLWQSAFGELWRWMWAHPVKAAAFNFTFLACGALSAEYGLTLMACPTLLVWFLFDSIVRVDLRRMGVKGEL